jgi:hypothetical protein
MYEIQRGGKDLAETTSSHGEGARRGAATRAKGKTVKEGCACCRGMAGFGVTDCYQLKENLTHYIISWYKEVYGKTKNAASNALGAHPNSQ